MSVSSDTGDIRSKDDLWAALAGAHTVFHLASLVDVGLKKNPAIEEVNVIGTRNVIEVCQELEVPFLVYTSSEDVVFSEIPVSGGDESLPYPASPLHDYVRTKIEGERAVHAQGKEALGVSILAAAHLPLLPVAPLFTAAVWYSAARYHRVHKRAHLDPAWAREHLPWHYDHHMGPNQEANWCVTQPWFDYVMGTRESYAGTPRKARDWGRHNAHQSLR